MKDIIDREHLEVVQKTLEALATYKRYEDVITIGAYKDGTNPKLDQAIRLMEKIRPFLRQSVTEKVSFREGLNQLREIFEGVE